MRLAYSAVGPVSSKRSPLVVLHGLFGSKLNWRTLSRRLSEELDRRVGRCEGDGGCFIIDLSDPWCCVV